ncbi:MAG: bifunctional oligoribonuclease/PAP phosphatase NrnA [Actinobacteria bacterium]|nr:bifunctional oligoribonuclease/PAP phosphatase NrnA [Actinomycetota bacterium]
MSSFEAPPWTTDIREEDWQAATDEILRVADAGGTVALTCHVDPDGDALGSLLAVQLFLRKRDVDTVASWGSEPFSIPPQYTFLPGLQELVPPSDFPQAPEVLISFDAGNRRRLGTLADVASNAGTLINVDHHASNDRFGDVNLVAPNAAATVVLVDELLRRLGGVPDREIATCLYTGLVTDTGRFQYRNTDRSAMELGSRLIGEGIEHAEMSRQMFETHSFGYLKVLARVLERAAFVPEASLVYSWVEQDDLDRFGISFAETEGLIDVLRTADAAEVTMIAKEQADGDWRVSMRSKGRTDVAALSTELGGGGHTYSAGFTGGRDLEAVVEDVVTMLAGQRGPVRSREGG